MRHFPWDSAPRLINGGNSFISRGPQLGGLQSRFHLPISTFLLPAHRISRQEPQHTFLRVEFIIDRWPASKVSHCLVPKIIPLIGFQSTFYAYGFLYIYRLSCFSTSAQLDMKSGGIGNRQFLHPWKAREWDWRGSGGSNWVYYYWIRKNFHYVALNVLNEVKERTGLWSVSIRAMSFLCMGNYLHFLLN